MILPAPHRIFGAVEARAAAAGFAICRCINGNLQDRPALALELGEAEQDVEREVIGERSRDKFAASRACGMWMGGHPPLGYDVRERKLVVTKAEAATVRMIFERFARQGSATTLARALAADGVTSKRGKPLCDELFPAGQARIVQLLVERVEVSSDGAELQLRVDGLDSLVRDLATITATTPRVA